MLTWSQNNNATGNYNPMSPQRETRKMTTELFKDQRNIYSPINQNGVHDKLKNFKSDDFQAQLLIQKLENLNEADIG